HDLAAEELSELQRGLDSEQRRAAGDRKPARQCTFEARRAPARPVRPTTTSDDVASSGRAAYRSDHCCSGGAPPRSPGALPSSGPPAMPALSCCVTLLA